MSTRDTARDFWARLLAVAQEGDEEALWDIQLHAKLLLSGGLIAQSGVATVGTEGGEFNIKTPLV